MTAPAIPRDMKPIEAEAYHAGIIAGIPLNLVDAEGNPRTAIDGIDELAESIRIHGVLEPIKVVVAGDRFRLVYGQRRLVAARQAGLERIPAIIAEDGNGLPPGHDLIEALVENIQRADLNPLDEAKAFVKLLELDGRLTQERIGAMVGRSQSYVSNAIRLLQLNPAVLELVTAGKLTAAHVKPLITLPTKEQRELAEDMVEQELSAHDAEEGVARWKEHKEWQRESAARDKASADKRAAADAASLEGAKAPKDAPIYVAEWSAEERKRLAKLLTAAGFTDVHAGERRVTPDRAKGHCDCTAWRAETRYNGGISIKPACVVQEHSDAAWRAEVKEREAAAEGQKRLTAALELRLRTELADTPRLVARVALWAALDWHVTDWVKERKGDRKKPDAWGSLTDLDGEALVKEAARLLAEAFRDRYNIKLNWQAIAAELGLEELAPAPAPKVRGKKAPAK
jgi:ParB family chromosome partitioning protein